MDFQTMYDNMQNEVKNKVAQIEAKKNEIAVLEADIYKIQGATEMLVLISKQMEDQKAQEPTEEVQAEVEVEEVKK